MDQLDFTNQRAFIASSVREEYYTSPEQERYYEQLTKSLINLNVKNDGTINNLKLNQGITDLKSESEEVHERNINDMTQVDENKSPGKNKDASTIKKLAYYESDEHEVKLGDSSKQVEASKEPNADTHVCNTSFGTTIVDPAVIGVGIIGQGGRGISQGLINWGTGIIISNVVKNVLKDYSKMIFNTDTFPLNLLKSQTLVIAS